VAINNLEAQLPYVLDKTDFAFLGEKYQGKVRDCYIRNDRRFLITTDRLSCFDVIVTTIPFKGQVLNQLAAYWFDKTSDIIDNHVIELPDPNVILAKNLEIIPIEVIVRGYLTGSAWRDYQQGKAISGHQLPTGLKASQALPEPIITPSTKAAIGDHDLPISEAEILTQNLVSKSLWEEVKTASFALFARGQKEALEKGLIFVDTKYEFGLFNGKLTLADEIHTLDCSRYWIAESYQERFKNNESPEMLDKEPIRQWLIQQGFMGEGAVPKFSDQQRVEIAEHYIKTYELITGKRFAPEIGDTQQRIAKNLARYA
jgi:phosphoribosylaminoimidazole-succinocarboxamide synthase